jgi:hypothetical protein
VCQRIVQGTPLLSAARDGGQRVSRLARRKHQALAIQTAESLTALLRERGVEHLGAGESEELWLVADGSELRKPYAREMPCLMRVQDLDGSLVSGYRTMNVVGITPSRRAILYHRLFSVKETDFTSESLEVQRALQEVHAAGGAATVLARELDPGQRL